MFKIPPTFLKAAVIAIIGLGFHSTVTADVLYPAQVDLNHYGKCYRATHDIHPGTIVERFVGREVKYADVPENEIIYAACHGDGIWTIPTTNARYINHSCHPNCTINSDSEVIAVRSIKAGEEITFDYVTISKEDWAKAPNEYFWDPRWSFTCQCGAENCYGQIDRYYIR
jgi:hypothetical protein